VSRESHGLVLGKSARYEERNRQERVEFFERCLANGSMTIRFACPECGGPHPKAEHVSEDDPTATKLALSYLDPVTRRQLQARLRGRRYRERQRTGNGQVAA
jgi:hypothetical protein